MDDMSKTMLMPGKIALDDKHIKPVSSFRPAEFAGCQKPLWFSSISVEIPEKGEKSASLNCGPGAGGIFRINAGYG